MPEPVLRKLTPISFVGGLLAAIGFVYATFYAILWIRMQPFGQAVLASYFVLTIVFFAVSYCVLLYTREAAGRTVLDLGPSPYRKGFLWSGACFLFLVVFRLFIVGIKVIEGRNINIDVVDMLSLIMMTVSAVFLLTFALDRQQIREKGIWFLGGLIKWDKIDSYDWDEDFLLVQKKVRFLVQKKVRFPFGAKVRIRVPPEHKDSVEELLKEHCSSDA